MKLQNHESLFYMFLSGLLAVAVSNDFAAAAGKDGQVRVYSLSEDGVRQGQAEKYSMKA